MAAATSSLCHHSRYSTFAAALSDNTRVAVLTAGGRSANQATYQGNHKRKHAHPCAPRTLALELPSAVCHGRPRSQPQSVSCRAQTLSASPPCPHWGPALCLTCAGMSPCSFALVSLSSAWSYWLAASRARTHAARIAAQRLTGPLPCQRAAVPSAARHVARMLPHVCGCLVLGRVAPVMSCRSRCAPACQPAAATEPRRPPPPCTGVDLALVGH
jgi:hypothetical protein